MNTHTTDEETKSNGKGKATTKKVDSADAIPTYPIEMIATGRLKPSPTQPRQTFKGIDEMGASIQEHGILTPLIVRKWGDDFEIVDGERRFRGGKKVGVEYFPCTVRALSDARVVEMQLVSQGQREDLHPLEEADTYALLQSKYSYSVDDIAAKTGKSTATIYNRLKLSALCKPAREAFLDEKISLAIALLLAKVLDPAKQAEATKRVLTEGDRWAGALAKAGNTMTVEEARNLIVDEYTLVLKDATFDRADAALVAAAGACTKCPKRTGANPALFSDFETKDDLCTDAKCFQAKKDADWTRRADDAKKRGLKVLSDAEAKKVLTPQGNAHGSSYVDLDARNFDDKRQRTNREILGKKAKDVEIVVARDDRGNAHELVAKKGFVAIAPVAAPSKPTAADTRAAEANKAHRAKEKAKELAHEARLASVIEIATKREPKDDFWRVMAASLADINHYRAREVCKRREIQVPEQHAASREIKKALAKMTGAEARGVCVELMCESSHYNAERLKAFESAFGGGAKPRAKVRLKVKAKKSTKR